MHTYENFHVFAHMCVLCPYVHVYVYTHMCTCTFFVCMYDLKHSKQSIDLCSKDILIPSAIFISIIMATEPLFSITHEVKYKSSCLPVLSSLLYTTLYIMLNKH